MKANDNEIVIQALFNDLFRLREEGSVFDLAIFSGDFVYAGSEDQSLTEVQTKFIEPLLLAAGISRDRLIIVPGNHDINVREVVPFLDHGLRDEFSNVEKINSFIDVVMGEGLAATVAAFSRTAKFESYRKGLNLGGTGFQFNILFFEHYGWILIA